MPIPGLSLQIIKLLHNCEDHFHLWSMEYGKWFEPRGISYLFGVIVQVRIVFRKTVVGDWRFDNLSGSHLQSQVKSRHQKMVFMPLVMVLIAQFCRDVIGFQNMKSMYGMFRMHFR